MASVKTPRTYASSLRARQAESTRTAVLDAAEALFVEGGYVATTIEDIARRAGVSRPTVFASVGNKATVLSDLRDRALAGDDDPIPVRERPWFQEMLDEPDAGRTLDLHARNAMTIFSRYALLDEVVQAGAGADAAVRELWETGEHQRLLGARAVAESVASKGNWRPGIDTETATQLLWTLVAGDLYRRLVHASGWSPDRYRSWLGETLRTQLLA